MLEILNCSIKKKELSNEEKMLYEKIKQLRVVNQKLFILFYNINNLVSSDKYNNERVIFKRLKELITDYR